MTWKTEDSTRMTWRTIWGNRKEWHCSMVPLSSLFHQSTSCAAVTMCCIYVVHAELAWHVPNTGFCMDGLHSTCTDSCIADISFTERWEPCVHMPGLCAMTVQQHLARSAGTTAMIPCHSKWACYVLREVSDSFLQFQAMRIGNPNTESFRKYESLAFFPLNYFHLGL